MLEKTEKSTPSNERGLYLHPGLNRVRQNLAGKNADYKQKTTP